MSEKHTPGPWSVGGPTDCINQLNIEPTIGVVYGAGDEVKANARLIAAAPDLLESVNRLLGWVEQESIPGGWRADDVAFARAAIAKATGDEQEHGDE